MLSQIAMADWVQFGALGLCGLMVLQNHRDRQALARELERRHREQTELVRRNTEAMISLAHALDDRPCLAGDSRLREGRL